MHCGELQCHDNFGCNFLEPVACRLQVHTSWLASKDAAFHLTQEQSFIPIPLHLHCAELQCLGHVYYDWFRCKTNVLVLDKRLFYFLCPVISKSKSSVRERELRDPLIGRFEPCQKLFSFSRSCRIFFPYENCPSCTLKVPGPISQNGDIFFKWCAITQEILVSNFS